MNRKPVFDAVRALLGRGFHRAEVRSLDAAIDAALAGDRPMPNAVGPAGIALIKQFEGCARRLSDGRVAAYPDPGTGGAPWTIGWGSTGTWIGPETIWSQAECDARLERDLVRYAADVATALGGAPTSQHQFDALVSFHYNTGAIGRATLTARHRAGDYRAAHAEFARWNQAAGRVLPGLVRRRAAESALYGTADP